MKYAVCILAHKEPVLLERIVNRLHAGNTMIFIHLDAKTDITPFLHIRNASFIENRVSINWGGGSIVKAMYHLLEAVLMEGSCEYLIFISGQDYPLVKPEQFHLLIDPKKNYVKYFPLPAERWDGGGLNRIDMLYFNDCRVQVINKALIRIQKWFGIKRKFLSGIEPYGGSQWISVTCDTAEVIRENWKRFFAYYRYTHIPDEMLFQTIILNTHCKHHTVNLDLHHIVWEKEGRHPKQLAISDYPQITKSNMLFCRKVVNDGLLDLLDQFCDANQAI